MREACRTSVDQTRINSGCDPTALPGCWLHVLSAATAGCIYPQLAYQPDTLVFSVLLLLAAYTHSSLTSLIPLCDLGCRYLRDGGSSSELAPILATPTVTTT